MQAADLGINQIILFEIEQNLQGIDIMAVREVIEGGDIRRVPGSPAHVAGITELRGEVLPVVALRKLFPFPTYDLSQGRAIVLLDYNGRRVGCLVDNVLRVQTVTEERVKPVDQAVPALQNHALGVVNDDMGLITILKTDALLELIGDIESLVEEGVDPVETRAVTSHRARPELDDVTRSSFTRHLKSSGIVPSPLTVPFATEFLISVCMTYDREPSDLVSELSQRRGNTIYSSLQPGGRKVIFDSDRDFDALHVILEDDVIPSAHEERRDEVRVGLVGDSSGAEALSVYGLWHRCKNREDLRIRIYNNGDNLAALRRAHQANIDKALTERLNHAYGLEVFSEADLEELRDQMIDEGKAEIITDVGLDIPLTLSDQAQGSLVHAYMLPDQLDLPKQLDIVVLRNVLSRQPWQIAEAQIRKLLSFLVPGGVIFLSEIEGLDPSLFPVMRREIDGRSFYILSQR